MIKNKHLLAPLGLLCVTAVSGVFLSSVSVSADDSVVDEINITVPVSCTLSGSGMTSHTTSIPNGTYTPDIGTTTLTAFCNDDSGFSIYAAGYTGNEIGATNSNKLVGTSASNNSTISTGTATGPVSGNDNSNWAMKLTAVSSPTPAYPITISTGFDSYHAVPNEYTKVATRLSSTDTGQNAEGSSLTTTYAAYISRIQPADTYSGQVKYTLLHPNTETPPTPGSFDAAFSNASKTKLNGHYQMQDISSAICNAVTLEDDASETTLIDNRDNKTYTVSKLKDGNCWMTQNLDHNIVADGTVTYNNTTTDLGWNSSTNSYGTANWLPDAATFTPEDTIIWDDALDTIQQSYDPGNFYWSGIPGDSTLTSTGNSHYHIGNYYSWTAAVAMNDSSSYTENGTYADQSICPAGWTLPRDGDQLTDLVDHYGFEGFGMNDPYIWDSPIHAPLSSFFLNSLHTHYIGERGNFWLAGVEDSYSSNTFSIFEGGDFVLYTSDARAVGFSVRCIAR